MGNVYSCHINRNDIVVSITYGDVVAIEYQGSVSFESTICTLVVMHYYWCMSVKDQMIDFMNSQMFSKNDRFINIINFTITV